MQRWTVPPALVGALLLLPAPALAGWQPAGQPSTSPGAATGVGVTAIGATPYAAWTDSASPSHVGVASWNGTAWTSVAGPLYADPARNSSGGFVAGVGGVPWVTFSEFNGTRSEAHVAKPNASGTGWDLLGSVLNADTRGAFAGPITTVAGIPYVAYLQDAPNVFNLRVARWNGTDWEQVGGVVSTPTVTAQSINIVDVGGVPYVAWSEGDGGQQWSSVKRWDAAAASWVQVGAQKILHDPTASGALPVLVSEGATPLIAWVELPAGGGDLELRAARFTGGAWTELGTGPIDTDSGFGSTPAVAVAAGTPYVGWNVTEGGVQHLRVANWNGRVWTRVDGPLNRDPARDVKFSAMTTVGGTPFAVWVEDAAGDADLNAATLVAGSTLRLSAGTYSALESQGSIDVTATRDGGSAGAVAVNYDTSAGTATTGSDYTTTSGTLNFADGQTTKTVSVPIALDDAKEGPETFTFTLSGPGGDAALGAPALATLTIDDDTVNTLITGGPDDATRDTSPRFSFVADPPGATFQCSVDGSAFTACASGDPVGPLAEGSHTFQVRAVGDVTPAQRTFIVDTTPPRVTVAVSARTDIGGRQISPGVFTGYVSTNVNGDDPAPGSGIGRAGCSIDPPTPPPTTVAEVQTGACSFAFNVPGDHVVYGYAIDRAGNESAVSAATFRILPEPDTTITGGPSGVTWTTTPTFTFTANIPGSTFRCSVDGAPYAPCSSPFTTPVLSGIGGHFIQVAAVSPSGAVDTTPARRDFTLRRIETHSFSCEIRGYKPDPRRRGHNGCTFEPAGTKCSGWFANCQSSVPTCPVGARCTYKVATSFTDADKIITWVPWAAVQPNLATPSESEPIDSRTALVGGSCATSDETPSCSASRTVEVIGDGRAPYFVCSAIGINPLGQGTYGPDASRVMTCDFTMSIEAAATLVTTTSADTVTTFAPGTGTVTAAPGGGSGRAVAAAKRTPLFKTIKKTVKKAGPVTFKLALSKSARSTFKKKKKGLKVTLVLTFKPKSGKTTKKTIKVTLRPKPVAPKRPKNTIK